MRIRDRNALHDHFAPTSTTGQFFLGDEITHAVDIDIVSLPPLLVLLPSASKRVFAVLTPISDSGLLMMTCSR